ncbi:unnamed protein product [Brassica oleracea]
MWQKLMDRPFGMGLKPNSIIEIELVIVVGIELKPGESRYFRLRNLDNEHRILHITATLCEGVGKEKSVIQYSIGDNKSPVDLCALLPNENESFSLSRELGCNDNSVEFSVTGDRVIDLTGYLQIDNPNRRNSIKMPHESYIRGRDRLPSLEELRRLRATLSMEEFQETVHNYLTNNDV